MSQHSSEDDAMNQSNEPDHCQVDFSKPGPPPQEPAQTPSNANKVYKSGPLFLSSKGLGWTSWKKRWFILTSTSLVFFRSDPNAILPKGSEVNCTLGGIDLNSSGSVVVKEDKKLITVQFSDGHDGRIFTLKAERLEDLNEWKAALEEALANAPNTGISVMQNETFNSDQANAADASVDQRKDIQPEKSLVIGRPVLLALENADGTPSFLEKALRFVEEHGVQVEGILRQAADVEDVEHRIREFEQGKTDFSPEEDAHVIADCVKYVLRELSSPPIPASCCKALVEAARTERSKKLAAMRHAIYETFPEPNCRLLQRILMMMHTIAANMAENRMSVSAVAACMAPLLLRPLLAGECELEQKSDAEGDGSVQLLQAAAAANNAQAICITLLEEYDNLFAEGTMSSDLYSETEESGSESEEHSNEGDTSEDYSDDDATDGDIEEDYEHTSSGRRNEAGRTVECDERSGRSHSGSLSEDFHETLDDDKKLVPTMTSNNASVGGEQNKDNLNASCEQGEVVSAELQSKPAEQADWKEKLLESLERWRIGLVDWQIALEEDVPRLEEQLQKESELTTALEAGLGGSQGPRNMSANCDEKTMETFGEIARVELEIDNLKHKADGLREKLNHQRAQNFRLLHMKDPIKECDLSSASNSNEKLQKNKHHCLLDKAEGAKGKKRYPCSSSCEHSTQQKLPDSVSNPNSTGILVSTSSTEVGISKPPSVNSRKSSAKGEGTNSSSVISKITNRFSFLNGHSAEKGRVVDQSLSRSAKGRSEGSHSLDRGKSESRSTADKR